MSQDSPPSQNDPPGDDLPFKEEKWAVEDENDEIDESLWTGLVTVGWMERVAFPEWGVKDLKTCCATSRETSSLHGEIRQVAPGRISLSLGQGELDLPLVQDTEALEVEMVVLLGGIRFPTKLTLVATSGPPHLQLGRDALAGRFLVDPSRSWVGSST
jgi:hypothetical protein